MKNKQKGVLHGECLIFQSKIPAKAEKLEVKEYLKIADSETTGNHHVVDCAEGVEFYMLDGVRYMRNTEPATVRCVHADRHDTITLVPGEWCFDSQKEYDYFAEAMRNVRD